MLEKGQYVRLDAGRGRRTFSLLVSPTLQFAQRSGAVDVFNSTRAIQAKFLRHDPTTILPTPLSLLALLQWPGGRFNYSSPHASKLIVMIEDFYEEMLFDMVCSWHILARKQVLSCIVLHSGVSLKIGNYPC